MDKLFKTFVEALQNGKMVFGSLFIASLLFLGLPKWVLELLSCSELPKWIFTLAGMICIISFAVLLTFFIGFLNKKYQYKILKKGSIKKLEGLTLDERAIIREYLIYKKTSVSGAATNGVIGGLEAKDIIFRSTKMSRGISFEYNIQTWAKEYFDKHPHLLFDVNFTIEDCDALVKKQQTMAK